MRGVVFYEFVLVSTFMCLAILALREELKESSANNLQIACDAIGGGSCGTITATDDIVIPDTDVDGDLE